MWALIRTVLAATGLLVSVTGFALFAGAAVGVWRVKSEVNKRTDALAARADTAVGAVDHAVTFVQEVIGQAEEDLKQARKSTEGMPPEPVNPIMRMGAQRASQELVGSVDRANAAVVAASDAVVVAKTALELFDKDEELQGWFGVKPEQLAQTRTGLGAATRDLKKAQTVLGIPIAPGAVPTPEQLNTIESALAQARGFTDQMGTVVATTRTRVAETKRSVDLWARWAALGVTLLGALAATGQFFTARFCWRVLRHKPA
ncbi:hypothetical protein J8F10_28695 [Gemmata sp. G18]|uniref:Uncharacterized protein n=1 Tax=Gemmata palustris TaxID=2822762 RepID=A0ABS5BZU1_9BACT|nr:hypothetical protein [Gemmata palustris]MBP3959242.1 hypothetical protein [Gemmata palustris]